MDFPAAPMTPDRFFTDWLPKAFAEHGAPSGAEAVDVTLGVLLTGAEGGEWVVTLQQGTIEVTSGTREGCSATYVQSVGDWQGALWEGAGGLLGRGAAAIFKPGSTLPEGSAAGPLPAATPAALEELAKLDGLVRMRVDGLPGGDWSVGFKLGSGLIPEEATATVSVSADDLALLESGELDPMTAFMSGKFKVEGDMTLLMQMQAIQMQVAAAQTPSA